MRSKITLGVFLIAATAAGVLYATDGSGHPLPEAKRGGSGGSSGPADLTTATGTLAIGHGGTNSATALNNGRVMVSSAGAIVENSAGTANQILHGDMSFGSVDLASAQVSGILPDANVSDTLTCSMFVGSGSTTTAVDLATAEVAGQLPDANVSDTLTASIFKGSGSTTDAVDLATAEVAGTLGTGNGGTGAASLSAAHIVLDNALAAFTAAVTQATTLTANAGGTTSGVVETLTTPVDTSGTNTHDGVRITPTIGNATSGSTTTVNGIEIDAVTGDADVTLNGIKIGALTGTAATETAINIGAGWDASLQAASPFAITGSNNSTIAGTLGIGGSGNTSHQITAGIDKFGGTGFGAAHECWFVYGAQGIGNLECQDSNTGQNLILDSQANAAGENAVDIGARGALTTTGLDAALVAFGHTLSGTAVYVEKIDGNGHTLSAAGVPTIAGTCGTTALTSGNDESGTVTSSCTAGQTTTVTYSRPYTTAHVQCVCTPANAAGDIITAGVVFCASTTSVLTITTPNAVTAGAFTYRCEGTQ